MGYAEPGPDRLPGAGHRHRRATFSGSTTISCCRSSSSSRCSCWGCCSTSIWRFNEKANPTPSKTTHNTLLEVAWTIVPVIILVFIAIPSFRLLTMQLTIPPADVTIKVTGVAMALELRLSQGSGRLLLRFLHEGRQGSEAGERRHPPARRSTTRRWCRSTRSSSWRSPRPTSSIPSSSSPSACASTRCRAA